MDRMTQVRHEMKEANLKLERLRQEEEALDFLKAWRENSSVSLYTTSAKRVERCMLIKEPYLKFLIADCIENSFKSGEIYNRVQAPELDPDSPEAYEAYIEANDPSNF